MHLGAVFLTEPPLKFDFRNGHEATVLLVKIRDGVLRKLPLLEKGGICKNHFFCTSVILIPIK
jgi:hypothetical protein